MPHQAYQANSQCMQTTIPVHCPDNTTLIVKSSISNSLSLILTNHYRMFDFGGLWFYIKSDRGLFTWSTDQQGTLRIQKKLFFKELSFSWCWFSLWVLKPLMARCWVTFLEQMIFFKSYLLRAFKRREKQTPRKHTSLVSLLEASVWHSVLNSQRMLNLRLQILVSSYLK